MTRAAKGRSAWAAVLGLAAGLLAAALPALASASAPTPTYAETRVWGFDLEMPAGVGAERPLSPTRTGAYAARYDEHAVGYPLVPRGTTRLLPEAPWRPTTFRAGELDAHFAKHAAEWGPGNITREAYLKRAQSLLSREAAGDIRGFVRPNGDVLRYNVRTNELAVGAPDGTIRTLFRPEDGLDYWLKQIQ